MEFQEWLSINESSLGDLYRSAVAAFPNTTKRQHATDPVRITQMEWIPYLGMKTLYIKGLAQSGESGKEYNPIVVFKGVKYHDTPNSGIAEIVASDGQTYLLERPSYTSDDVLLRCNCADFQWRFNYYDHLDKSLYGRKRSKYESQGGPPANPKEMPGMCKHLMKLVRAIDQSSLMRG